MTRERLFEWMEKGSKVIVSEDRMSADLLLCPPPVGGEYSLDMVLQMLAGKRIAGGILKEKILGMLQRKAYFTRITVASGTPAVDGKDGSFEYFFDTEVNNKPKILPDGSADYRTMAHIPTVSAGSVIARYIPAGKGEEGKDLYGNVLPARQGRELPELKGKGFSVSGDRQAYTASISGKIIMENGKITIQDFLEVKEDVDLLTGDIHFDGDILIHGNVNGGRKVDAGGSLVVEGHVESCELSAGGDIILAHGMQGGGKGIISSKGSVSGRFFEQAEITAGGNVSANSILNCNVKAGGDIEIAGRQGAIVGGRVFAGRSIQASTVGNVSEVQTELAVGDGEGLAKRLRQLDQEYGKLKEQMDRTKYVLQRILERRDASKEKEPPLDIRMQMIQVTRLKIMLDSKMNAINQEKEDIMVELAMMEEARITIRQSAYPGTRVYMDGAFYQVKEVLNKITLRKKEDGIKIYSNR